LPKLQEAERIEHDLASVIVSASTFTKQTLIENGVSPERIRVNPLGVDYEDFKSPELDNNQKLRFGFVGAIKATKGIPLLLEAWEKLGARNSELWLVGSASKKTKSLLPQLPGLQYKGPIPHVELPSLLQQCDVFVFPSYFEGFGLVILEAMAAGLPVITTTATAGPDIITQGHDGFIIEPGNVYALVNKMEFCLHNRDRVTAMGANARKTAERFTWDAYGDQWMGILEAAVRTA
jgi:glycosyltransferase involved in cell wall biosynthesis